MERWNRRGCPAMLLAGPGVFCLILLLLTSARTSAQDLRYLAHQSWSTEEGLPQTSVHAITQTPDGFLWIATEAGLARFDGISFRVFDHSTDAAFTSDDVCCLAVDAAGALWIGTARGLLVGSAAGFKRVPGSSAAAVLSITASPERGHAIKVETTEEVEQWQDQRLVSHMASTQAPETPLRDGWNWSPAAVRLARLGKSMEWRARRELPGPVQAVLIDRSGLAWVGTRGGLVVLHDDQRQPQEIASLKGDSVLALFEDSEGDHWIGTETSGLHVLRRLKFRTEPAIAGVSVTSIAHASDGAMWFGTRDDGLLRLQGSPARVSAQTKGLTSSVILCLAPGLAGSMWAGTPDGLNLVTAAGSVTRITTGDGLPDDFIRVIASTADGSVWVGTQHGLARLRGGKVDRTWTVQDGLEGEMVGALLPLPHAAWAATSGGLSYVPEGGAVLNFNARIATSIAPGSNGNLWVATRDHGLQSFDGQQLRLSASLAPDAVIEGLTTDHEGYLWIRMASGVLRVAESRLRACVAEGGCPLAQIAARYGRADGLPNDEVVAQGSPAGVLAHDGEMWFSTRRGVGVVDTRHVPRDLVPPPVVLERVQVDDFTVPAAGNQISIPFGHSRITLEYAGLSFLAPAEVHYRVRLLGFDPAWTDAGTRRSATYTNLPPGAYTFVVQAVNGDGAWNQTGASVSFHIVPPYYRRWWFLVLLVLLCGLLLLGLYLLRLRRLRREFDAVLAERNRMAREIHDTLTQDFVGTSLQLDVVAQMLERGKVAPALEQVKRTRQLVTAGLEEARRSIWELRANRSQDSLPTRLSRLAAREDFGALKPRVTVGGAYCALDPSLEREILRIAQEALTNVLHHARAGKVLVELHYSSDTLMLAIEDDGVGFEVAEVAEKPGHYGLVGMGERAAIIDAALEIASQPGHGTKVTLRVPMAQA